MSQTVDQWAGVEPGLYWISMDKKLAVAEFTCPKLFYTIGCDSPCFVGIDIQPEDIGPRIEPPDFTTKAN